MPIISVIVPVYGCADSLRQLCSRLNMALALIVEDHEIILVNDASPDLAWTTIQSLAISDEKIRGINLSRNFGQHYAITAGLDFARGDWVVVMDCDLQDQPEDIPRLYKKALEGFDLVIGRRTLRQDSFLKKIASRAFYKVFSYLSGTSVDHRIGNFGIYARKVIRSIQFLKEQNRSFGLFALWVGFRRTEIDVEHVRRPCGKSSYTLGRMITLAMDSLIAHSNKLLRASIKLGFLLASLSIFASLWLFVRYFVWSTPIAGWTSLMVSLFFATGLIIGTIGILGLYIGKIFDEVKGRPLYIIDSTTFGTDLDNKLRKVSLHVES